MKTTVAGAILALGALGALGGSAGSAQPAKPDAPAAAKAQLSASVAKGLAYLRRTQQEDGSWQRYPGITALTVMRVYAVGRVLGRRRGHGAQMPADVAADATMVRCTRPPSSPARGGGFFASIARPRYPEP